jgi:hypothetical protein
MEDYEKSIEDEYKKRFPKQRNFIDAHFIDLELSLNDESEDVLIDILRDLKLKRDYHHSVRSKRVEAIKCLIANLLKISFLDVPLRYSRNHNTFAETPNTPDWYTYKIVLNLFDALAKNKWIEEHKGYKNHEKGGRSFQSRALPSEKLKSFILERGLTPRCIKVKYIDGNEVRLREKVSGNKWRDVKYKDNKETLKWKRELRDYNSAVDSCSILVSLEQDKLLNQGSEHRKWIIRYALASGRIKSTNDQTYISLNSNNQNPSVPSLDFYSDYVSDHDNYFYDHDDYYSIFSLTKSESQNNQKYHLVTGGHEKKEKFLFCREHLYRVFNGSWRAGGRFWGPTYQGFSEDLRKNIYINNDQTIERDYVAMHLSLALNQAGYKVIEDPYLRLTNGNLEHRNAFKLVGYTVLYSSSWRQATQGLNYSIRKRRLTLPKGTSTKDAIDQFVIAFPELDDFMFKGLGLKLQFYDSEIMNRIIK